MSNKDMPSMTPSEFKSIKDKLGMTQQHLSFCLGVTAQMVRYYLTGHNPIPDDIAQQMLSMESES